jgi:glycosyltransferase involved in cell wall biosynthesis
MSRFPKITETFILYEILEHQRRGDTVEIYPLMRERQAVTHPDAARAVERAHFLPFLSPAILRANWYYLRRRPGAYWKVMKEVLRGTFGNTNYFMGALVFFPKSVAFAYDMEHRGLTHVHAHYATHPALSALIIHRLTGIPFSFTAHAHDVHRDRRMLGQKLAAAKFAVSISEHNRDLMTGESRQHLRDKIRIIHCGADTSYFRPSSAPAPPGPLNILCVASLLEMKGHADLIRACHLLRQRGIAFHCDFIGDGKLKEALVEQVARAGLQNAISFLGPQSRAVVLTRLQQSHVKVLACTSARDGVRDGIPVALMEAMACGLPVVSTVLSGVPELVEDGISGILVKPRDPAALANALERLARDPGLRARLGAAGRERVLRDFDLAANAQTLAALFAGAVA